jgi:shikimate 5-dehydrogenase
MTAKLTGKVASITGASAGIGQACARVLAQEGARLVLTARRQQRLDQLKQEAEKVGTQAIRVLGRPGQTGGKSGTDISSETAATLGTQRKAAYED